MEKEVSIECEKPYQPRTTEVEVEVSFLFQVK